MAEYNDFQKFLSSLKKGSELTVSLCRSSGLNGLFPEYRSYGQISSGEDVLKLPEYKCHINDSEKRILVKLMALRELVYPLRKLKEIKNEMDLTIRYKA